MAPEGYAVLVDLYGMIISYVINHENILTRLLLFGALSMRIMVGI